MNTTNHLDELISKWVDRASDLQDKISAFVKAQSFRPATQITHEHALVLEFLNDLAMAKERMRLEATRDLVV